MDKDEEVEIDDGRVDGLTHDVSFGLNGKLTQLLMALGKPVGLFQNGVPDGFTAVEIAFDTGLLPSVVFMREDGRRLSTAVPMLSIAAVRDAFSLPGAAQRMRIIFEQGKFTRYHYEFAADFDCLDKLIEAAETRGNDGNND